MTLFDDFFIRALWGGAAIGMAASLPGCFVIWRRMAFFGDTIAHAAMLGMALSFMLQLPLAYGTFAIACAMAFLLFSITRKQNLSPDTWLSIIAHGTLALGIVSLSFMPWLRINLHALLFGNILAITKTDLLFIYALLAVMLLAFFLLWRPLLCSTISPDIAQAEGLKPERAELLLLLILALFVTMAIKLVGLLLITALMVIPAASARQFSKSPEMMIVMAALLGTLSTISGLYGSLMFDTPTGPTIVLCALVIFLLARIAYYAKNSQGKTRI